MTRAKLPLLLALLAACGDNPTTSGTPNPDNPGQDGGSPTGPDGGPISGNDGSTPSGDGSVPPGPIGTSSAANLAKYLRGKSNFLIGMGNDLANNHDQDGAYTLGTTLDLHYAYLVGLPGSGGWPDWNAGGTFVDMLATAADKHGVVPMFTLYAMAAWGDGNISVVTNDQYMGPYWSGAKLLMQRLGVFGKPAVVHLEPDFWGYAIQKSADGTAPVHVTPSECAGMPQNFRGMAQCLLKLARTYAPKAVVGFHVSEWGADVPKTIAFFKAIGADKGDYISTDMLDRDAGCFEAHTDPNCQRGGTTGWYWDETNQTSPNFHEHFAWVKQITTGIGLPMMWWQVPFGTPSPTPGGTSGHYRDNRVHYMFSHVSEMIAAGGVGAAFGTGAGNQTDWTTDGGQFKTAATKYFSAPVALP